MRRWLMVLAGKATKGRVRMESIRPDPPLREESVRGARADHRSAPTVWLYVVLCVMVGVVLSGCVERYPEGITVVDAWVRPSPLANGTGAAYLEIRNCGSVGDALIGVSADFVESAELHESIHSGDMVSMSKMDFVSIPAGDSVVFEPGGYHVMLINQQKLLSPGDMVTLTLIFEHAGEMQVEAEVRNE